MSSFTNPMNIASPLSPLNPLNPLNPASPLNPLNQSNEPDPPANPFDDGYHAFQHDLDKAAGPQATQWLGGGADLPQSSSLRATADGFAMHVVRHGLFGPTREVDYLYNRAELKVEVQETSLQGKVGQFLSGRPAHEHYQLDLNHHTLRQL